jgi:hypothetical protein
MGEAAIRPVQIENTHKVTLAAGAGISELVGSIF